MSARAMAGSGRERLLLVLIFLAAALASTGALAQSSARAGSALRAAGEKGAEVLAQERPEGLPDAAAMPSPRPAAMRAEPPPPAIRVAPAEPRAVWALEAGLSFVSHYVWRGYVLSDEGPVAQPSVALARGPFSLEAWGNFDFDDPLSREARWNETDLTLAYEAALERVSLTTGATHYLLAGAEDTSELFVGVSLKAPLEPSLTLFKDVGLGEAWFVELGLGHEARLVGGGSLGVGLILSAAREPDADARAHHAEARVSYGLPRRAGVGTSLFLAYSEALGSDARRALSAGSVLGRSSIVFGGMSLGWAE